MYPTKKLSEICSKAGSNISQNQLSSIDGDYPVYGASGLIKNVDFYHQENEYIGIVKDGAGFGRAMILPKRSSVIGTLQYLIPNKETNVKFLFYACNHIDFTKYKSGTTIPHIYFRDYGKEEIFFPPLSTQSRIVARLDSAFASIDEQISLLRENIVDVENMRKSVLEESFQKGEYEMKKLEDIVCFLSGGTPSKSNKAFWIGNIPWISPKDMKQDKLDSATDYISQSAIDSSATRLLPVNSLLCVTRSGILVRSFPVAINTIPVAFNQDIRAIIPGKNVDSEYLFYALRAKEREILSNGIKKGPTVHSIISGYLDKLEIPLPPLPRQHEIVTQLDRVFTETASLRGEYEAQIRDLQTLKQSLLEEAFAGRLVTDRDI